VSNEGAFEVLEPPIGVHLIVLGSCTSRRGCPALSRHRSSRESRLLDGRNRMTIENSFEY